MTAWIVSKDNKVLMGRKHPNSGAVYEDCWHKPGGGVEQGESDEQAVKREVLEETGLTIGDVPVLLIYDKDSDRVEKTLKDGEKVIANMQFNNYKVELDNNSIDMFLKDTDELIDLTWFGFDKLDTLKLTPPMRKVINLFGLDWLKQGQKAPMLMEGQ